VKLVSISLILGAGAALACGPFFPATVLDRPDLPRRAHTLAFDLAGMLPTNSVWRAAPADAHEQHADDACLAAYRQGRELLGRDDAEAVACFRRTRLLLARCPADDKGLGAASIGWEGRAELNRGQLVRAANLYIEHYASGDPTAAASLRIVVGRMLATWDNGATLRAAARQPRLRDVVTLYLAARGGPFLPAPPHASTVAWLQAVESLDVRGLERADLLAWAAYQAGDFTNAARWLDRARRQSAAAAWLRAKLLLRDGKLDEAAALLARAVHHFPRAQDWPRVSDAHFGDDRNVWTDTDPVASFDQARGELAALQLDRGDYRDALDLLLRAGYWTDAAHVAERVMRVEELIAFVEQVPDRRLQHLLARRLGRMERHDEARRYLPEELRPKLGELTTALAARDAVSLWRAAQIMRHHGMELIGTELAPDWHLHGGAYQYGFDYEKRLAPATPDVAPLIRFHYRYRAAELAWEAARLMPDNDIGTARVLCEAGTWLKNRDPQAADRFYKALVRRCGRTDIGREADQLRWFPPLAEISPPPAAAGAYR
jgi:tetratricopeptide (TPR) repeat protein